MNSSIYLKGQNSELCNLVSMPLADEILYLTKNLNIVKVDVVIKPTNKRGHDILALDS